MKKPRFEYIFVSVIVLIEIVVFVIPLASCFYSCAKWDNEQRKIYQSNITQAKINAVSYIENKYGFKADVLDVVCDYQQGMFNRSVKNYCVVTMEYDRKFYVAIDGSKETNEGWDSYQYKEIENFIIKRAEEALPGAENYYFNNHMHDINLDNAAYELRRDTGEAFTFYQNKFDGNDLKALFKDAPIPTLSIEYNSDISYKELSRDIAEVFPDLDMDVSIIHNLDSDYNEIRSFGITNGKVQNDMYEKKLNKE